MKRIISIVLIWLAAVIILVAGLIGLLKLSKFAISIGATSIQSCELPIAEKFVSVGRLGKQTTTFVVVFENVTELNNKQIHHVLIYDINSKDVVKINKSYYENLAILDSECRVFGEKEISFRI